MIKLLYIISLMFLTSVASAESYLLNTTGTTYCPGYYPQKFNPKNDINLYITIDLDINKIYMFTDRNLTNQIATLQFETGSTTSKSIIKFSAFAVWDQSDTGDNVNSISSVGNINLTKAGYIKSFSGRIFRRGIFDNCFSNSTFTTTTIN